MRAAALTGPDLLAPPLGEAFPRLRRLEQLDRGYVERLEGLQRRARGFANSQLRDAALEMDRRTDLDPGYVDWDLVRAGGRLGMLNLLLPEQVGGEGCLTTQIAIVMEELCAACPGLALIFGAHALGISPLLFDGPLHWDVMGELAESALLGEPELMACALTEPDAGTDVEDGELIAKARIASRARPVAGGYSLSGTKRFISNGSIARWITVLMPIDPKRPAETWTCFLVDTRSKGFSVSRAEHKMGQRACPAAEIVFDEVFVPTDRVVGRPGDGVGTTLIVLSASRPPVGAIATGIARGAYERLRGWMSSDPEARALLDRQGIQMRLAGMAERIHLARQAYLDAAMEIDLAALEGATNHPLMRGLGHLPSAAFGKPRLRRMITSGTSRGMLVGLLNRSMNNATLTRCLGLSSLAKAQGGDTAMSVTSTALEIAGLTDAPVRPELEKLWRDAKLCQIYEGTNQLNRLEVYKTLVAGQTMPILPRPGRTSELAGAAV